MKIEKIYNATGYVLGNYWGGGSGSYAASKLRGFTTKEELISEAERKLKEGSLDSGMGYESLIGAVLNIEEVKIIKYKDEEYKNSTVEDFYLGDLSDDQIEFLAECNCFG